MGTTKSGEGIGERVKTDLRLPKLLLERVEEVCYALGIPTRSRSPSTPGHTWRRQKRPYKHPVFLA